MISEARRVNPPRPATRLQQLIADDLGMTKSGWSNLRLVLFLRHSPCGLLSGDSGIISSSGWPELVDIGSANETLLSCGRSINQNIAADHLQFTSITAISCNLAKKQHSSACGSSRARRWTEGNKTYALLLATAHHTLKHKRCSSAALRDQTQLNDYVRIFSKKTAVLYLSVKPNVACSYNCVRKLCLDLFALNINQWEHFPEEGH